MNESDLNHIFDKIHQAEEENKLILFTGSGINKDDNLKNNLDKNIPQSNDLSDIIKRYTSSSNNNLQDIANDLINYIKRASNSNILNFNVDFAKYFQIKAETIPPYLLRLSKINFSQIYTTNYDNLLSLIYTNFDTIKYSHNCIDRINKDNKQIIHLHGDHINPIGSDFEGNNFLNIIIGEYLMSGEKPNQLWNSFFYEQKSNVVLYIGTSLNEPNLRTRYFGEKYINPISDNSLVHYLVSGVNGKSFDKEYIKPIPLQAEEFLNKYYKYKDSIKLNNSKSSPNSPRISSNFKVFEKEFWNSLVLNDEGKTIVERKYYQELNSSYDVIQKIVANDLYIDDLFFCNGESFYKIVDEIIKESEHLKSLIIFKVPFLLGATTQIFALAKKLINKKILFYDAKADQSYNYNEKYDLILIDNFDLGSETFEMFYEKNLSRFECNCILCFTKFLSKNIPHPSIIANFDIKNLTFDKSKEELLAEKFKIFEPDFDFNNETNNSVYFEYLKFINSKERSLPWKHFNTTVDNETTFEKLVVLDYFNIKPIAENLNLNGYLNKLSDYIEIEQGRLSLKQIDLGDLYIHFYLKTESERIIAITTAIKDAKKDINSYSRLLRRIWRSSRYYFEYFKVRETSPSSFLVKEFEELIANDQLNESNRQKCKMDLAILHLKNSDIESSLLILNELLKSENDFKHAVVKKIEILLYHKKNENNGTDLEDLFNIAFNNNIPRLYIERHFNRFLIRFNKSEEIRGKFNQYYDDLKIGFVKTLLEISIEEDKTDILDIVEIFSFIIIHSGKFVKELFRLKILKDILYNKTETFDEFNKKSFLNSFNSDYFLGFEINWVFTQLKKFKKENLISKLLELENLIYENQKFANNVIFRVIFSEIRFERTKATQSFEFLENDFAEISKNYQFVKENNGNELPILHLLCQLALKLRKHSQNNRNKRLFYADEYKKFLKELLIKDRFNKYIFEIIIDELKEQRRYRLALKYLDCFNKEEIIDNVYNGKLTMLHGFLLTHKTLTTYNKNERIKTYNDHKGLYLVSHETGQCLKNENKIAGVYFNNTSYEIIIRLKFEGLIYPAYNYKCKNGEQVYFQIVNYEGKNYSNCIEPYFDKNLDLEKLTNEELMSLLCLD